MRVWRKACVPRRMSGDEVNPAAEAQPVEDVQGDGRWMSQVGGVCLCVYLNLFIYPIKIIMQ